MFYSSDLQSSKNSSKRYEQCKWMRQCNVLAGVPQLAGQRQPHHRLNIFWKGKKRVMRHETRGSQGGAPGSMLMVDLNTKARWYVSCLGKLSSPHQYLPIKSSICI